MRHRRRRARAFLLAAAWLIGLGCRDRGEVATLVLAPTDLRHDVGAEGQLKAAKVTSVTVPPDVRDRVRLAWLAADGSRVRAGETVARFDDSDLRSQLGNGRADLEGSTFKLDKTRAEQAGTVAGIDTARQVADLELAVAERFQLTDQAVFSRHEIIESEIDGELATVRRHHALADQESAEVTGRTALDILDIERGEAERRVSRARQGLEALEVRAPHDGLFLRARNWRREPLQVGSELWPGRPVGEIPDLATLEVEAFVLEADAGALAVGQRATVVVDAHPDRRFAATVRHVDTIAKPRFRGSPVQYFGVTLRFDEAVDARLKPGQRVHATLHLAARDGVLAVPRQAVVATADGYRVYRAEGGGFVAREVTLGETTAGLVEITAGLEAGDRVALEPEAMAAAAGGGRAGAGPRGGGAR